ncbi:MAG: prepilin-type N-terminal cleavage/methylation domain-containing protein [Planctomycetota bacterium]
MKRPGRRKNGAGGFTLLEVVVAMTLLTLVLANLYMIFGDSSRAITRKTAQYDTEVEARRVLDRIAMAVIGAELDTLEVPNSAPNSSSEIDYSVNLGVQSGAIVWSSGRRIAHQNDHEVEWRENPGEPDERHAVWTRASAKFLEGEISNGIDDNGNGLIDERGLSFEVQGKMVVIRITIEKPGPEGTLSTKTLETRVTCRN